MRVIWEVELRDTLAGPRWVLAGGGRSFRSLWVARKQAASGGGIWLVVVSPFGVRVMVELRARNCDGTAGGPLY